jgi:hypothetical protein
MVSSGGGDRILNQLQKNPRLCAAATAFQIESELIGVKNNFVIPNPERVVLQGCSLFQSTRQKFILNPQPCGKASLNSLTTVSGVSGGLPFTTSIIPVSGF